MANGNIHFYGKAYKDDFQIFLSVTFRRGHRLRYYTGIRVPNEFWDTQKQCVKSARKYPQSAETNSYLRNLANEASRIIVSFQNQKEFLTDKKLKEKLDAFRNKKSDGEDPITFISFFERQIKERKGNPSRYSNSSIKVYQTTFNKILEFAKDKKRSIDFADFDHSFFESFTNYLFDRKFQPNYVHKITSNLQTFLKEAFLREISSELKYKENWLKVSRQSVESIYLNEEELDQIYHLKFPKKEEHLERARDLFLIGCYTGLRYSDFSHLKAANIHILKGVKVLKVLTQKTGQQVTIPQPH